MGRTTDKFTYTDGSYFCNACDSPHEGEELAEDCYDACMDEINVGRRYPWVIHGRNERLFWSNEDGWVDPASATKFSTEEKETIPNLPGTDSAWVRMDSSIVTNWKDPDDEEEEEASQA